MNADKDAAGWREHAEPLAEFVLTHLPNRIDRWGAYLRPAYRQADKSKVWTAPAAARRGIDFLSRGVVRQHFCARDGGDTIGLHTTSDENTSRWLGFDFDVHEEPGAAVSDKKRASVETAFWWCVDALGERCSLLLEDSDGDGGRHLWTRFDAPIDTPALYVFAASIAEACKDATGELPETFPKQARLQLNREGGKMLGNWLRLPGRHHTRPYWSRLALADGAWRSGADAAAVFLSWASTPADAVPPIESWPVSATPPVTTTPYDPRREPFGTPRSRADRIENLVRKVPHGTAGSQRSDRLFYLAAVLRHDLQCHAVEALPILRAWNLGNTPPLPDWKIEDTWQNAGNYGGRRAA